MLKIGITGGIGSGKSTIAKIFEILGIPVYYTDYEAKKMMNTDADLKHQIQAAFGNDAYVNGELNRSYLSSVVFNDAEKLQLLNSIVHPATITAAEKWMQQQHAPYTLKEAALIFESGAQQHLDYVIGVFAPVSLRIQRVMQRDKITREEVMARMTKQIDETVKMRLCDYVIKNDELELVIPQVIELHKQLLSLTQK